MSTDPKNFRKPKRAAHLTAAADVLQSLLANSKSELGDGFVRWRLEQQWSEVVGDTIAENTVPCAFENGILHIWVKHPVWMQQLSFFQDEIRQKVNKHVGRSWAKKVRFTLSRRAASTSEGNSPE
jgi:predicted nucleic acid-binding Zn ribbon protein